MYKTNPVIIILIIIPLFASCNNNKQTDTKKTKGTDSLNHSIHMPARSGFTDTIDGKPTDLYILKNSLGTTLAITNYGKTYSSFSVYKFSVQQ